jgi:hypothetical protein
MILIFVAEQLLAALAKKPFAGALLGASILFVFIEGNHRVSVVVFIYIRIQGFRDHM